jgi:N-methylhydantoinase B
MGNEVSLRVAGKPATALPNAKVLTAHLRPGDAFTLKAGGGGGFGPAIERAPELVAHDVRQGYVSAETARSVYRVALDAEGRVDVEETRRLRSSREAVAAA